MSDFANYTKPNQIAYLETLLFGIGFNRQLPTYWSGVFHYKYDNWVIMIEHKKHDSFSERIRFELFKMDFLHMEVINKPILYEQNNYEEIIESLYHGYQNEKRKEYEEDFNKFMTKCDKLLKKTFKHEIRKMKIGKLFQ